MQRVFQVAFGAGISALALLFIGGIALNIFELSRGKMGESSLLPFQIAAFACGIIFLASTLLLWIEGWIFVWERKNVHSRVRTVLLVLALVFCNIFAGYGLHVLRRRQVRA